MKREKYLYIRTAVPGCGSTTCTISMICWGNHYVLLQVAHMTKNELEYLDSALIGPAMLFLNQYFNFFLPEYIVLWLCLVSDSYDDQFHAMCYVTLLVFNAWRKASFITGAMNMSYGSSVGGEWLMAPNLARAVHDITRITCAVSLPLVLQHTFNFMWHQT